VEDADAVAAVCELTDRLPLALEMAAGLLRTMSADDIVDRVDRRLELLGSGRARTLRATIDSSVDALGPLERTAFARLSVFAGPFSLAHAERVIADDAVAATSVASLVAALRDHSLLQSAPGPTGHRVRMLPILRDVATADLGAETDAARRRHLALFVDEAEAIDRGVRRPEDAVWAAVAGTELPDLRAALRHALASNAVDEAGRIAAGLFHFVYGRVRPDVGSWSSEVLQAGPPHDVRLHARLGATAALAAFQTGDVDGAFETATAARQVADGDPVRRFADLVLANVELAAGRLGDARRAGARAASDAETAGDHYVAAVGHVLAALSLGYDRDVDRALGRVDDARRAAVVAGSPTAMAYVDYAEAEILAELDPLRAEALLKQAIDSAAAVGATLAEAVAWVTLSSIRARHGDPASAVAGFQEAIRHWRDRGDAQRQWVTLRNLAELLARIGHHVDAAVILGAVEASAPPPYGAEAVRLTDTRRRLLDRLGPAAEHHLDRGRRLPRRDVVDRCLSLRVGRGRPVHGGASREEQTNRPWRVVGVSRPSSAEGRGA
jgi:tetratricopeptide (TPR) repeat protein